MKVLFYVEPFPIRNSMTQFSNVGHKVAHLLSVKRLIDLRLYANRATLEQLTKSARGLAASAVLEPTDAEDAIFRSDLVDWDDCGMAAWQDLMAGGRVADRYVDVLSAIWARFRFDVIVHWGDNGAINRFVAAMPVTRIAMELGCTRPPYLSSVIFDLFGTNGAAMPTRLAIDDIAAIVDNQGMSAAHALQAYSDTPECLGYEAQFSAPNWEISATAIGSNRHRKRAFLPLQLYDDANLLRFSKYKTLTDVVLDVVPRLADHGYLTIIKPHPAAKQRPSGAQENRVARAALSKYAGAIHWCEGGVADGPNAQMFRLADIVVTVNSSVGFEALYYDKPVVVLGDAVYKPAGLFPTLDDILADRFDDASYLQRIGCLRKYFLESYLAPEPWFSDLNLFYHRVATMAGVHASSSGAPAPVARNLYAAFAPAQRSHHAGAMLAGLAAAGASETARPSSRLPVAAKPMQEISLELPGISAHLNRNDILQKLTKISGIFSQEKLAAWLTAQEAQPESRRTVIAGLELFDEEYYIQTNPDVLKRNNKPFDHFLVHGEYEGRSPHPEIDTSRYKATRPKANKVRWLLDLVRKAVEHTDGLPAPLEPAETALLQTARARLRGLGTSPDRRVAVLAHLYYRDQVPELLDRLGHIPDAFDLFVTLPAWGARPIEDLVLERRPQAVILRLPSRGHDIGSFVELLPVVLARNYLALLKISTKKAHDLRGQWKPDWGAAWRHLTLDALLGSSERVAEVLAGFAEHAPLQMLGAAPFLVKVTDDPIAPSGLGIATGLGLDAAADNGAFFPGSMFWVRPQCLAPLAATSLSLAAFDPDAGTNDASLPQELERCFGLLALKGGGKIGTIDPTVRRAPLKLDAKPSEARVEEFIVNWIKDSGATARPQQRLMWQ